MTNGELAQRNAELELRVNLIIGNIHPDVAEVLAFKHAGDVKIADDGAVDVASVQSVAAAVIAAAPAKFRNDATGESPALYDNLRKAVAARHAARDSGGISELAKRMGT